MTIESTASPVRRARLSQGAEMLARRLSAQHAEGQADCDVLIVGSGYGGAVAAARFAGANEGGAKVWVLERGQEHLPGSFPSQLGTLPGHARFSRQDGKAARGKAEALFDIRLGGDVSALVGNGLGGGSLINAGVMEEPDPDYFAAGWPAGIDDVALAPHCDQVRQMIGAQPFSDAPSLAKYRSLEAIGLASTSRLSGGACRIAVSETDGVSAAGMKMHACTRCGDCVTGCNIGAKATLDTNYLAWAVRGGADLYCGGWVERVEPVAGSTDWLVHWHYTEPRKRPPGAAAFVVRARCVVLAAGSLGSTEILLRSRGDLAVSDTLGQRFSTNGDQIAAIFRQQQRADVSRDEGVSPAARSNVGPTITGLLRMNGGGLTYSIEDFSVPSPLRALMGEVTTTFGLVHGMFGPQGWPKTPHPADVPGQEDEFAVTTSSLAYTSILGLMGDDGAAGSIVLAGDAPVDGQIRIVWPRDDSRLENLWDQQIKRLEDANQDPGLNGIVVPSPLWRMLPEALAKAVGIDGGSALTVHPLGGCAMAEDAGRGVVNSLGQVFRTDVAGGVYSSLAVLDGAIVPTALGINPSLTIAALAEHAIAGGLARAFGLTLADQGSPGCRDLPQAQQPLPLGWSPPSGTTSVRVSEQMRGRVQLDGRSYWAELEIPGMRLNDLAPTLRTTVRLAQFETRIGDRMKSPELRLYETDAEPWFLQERANAVPTHTLVLDGHAEIFKTAAAAPDSAPSAALLDAVAVLAERLRGRRGFPAVNEPQEPVSALATMQALANAADLLTRQWTIEYHFRVVDGGTSGIAAMSLLEGTKTLAFAPSANPWKQLSRMSLVQGARLSGQVDTDLGYFARLRQVLFELVEQRDHPSALVDLIGFGLYTLRLMIATHWPHFVPPGDMPTTIAGDREQALALFGGAPDKLIAAGRRPGRLDGIDPDIFDLGDGLVLSRYLPSAVLQDSRPLLMIHGLSAAGSTFAHPSIEKNMVRTMLRNGRDVWVVDLRTSSANESVSGPPRAGPFSFEEIAAEDLPLAVATIELATGRHQIDVIAHCVGSAMLCQAVLTNSEIAERIGSAVLSQVSPLAELSPLNRFRGMLASFLETYLAKEEVEVRPGFRWDAGRNAWVEGAAAGASGRLLIDAVLATLPYPDGDTEAERASALGADFRSVRHHADAIFGRLFQLENMGDDTLRALDSIFGFAKTRSVARIAHIARERALTNAAGDTFVGGAALARAFRFPVLLLHGRLNDVFDWHGSWRTWRAISGLFGDDPDSLPPSISSDLHLGGDSAHQLRVLGRYGHQDLLIGRDAHLDVFPHIESFLSAAGRQRSIAIQKASYVCEAPFVGPVLGWLRAVPGEPTAAQVSVLVHPGRRHDKTLCVVLMPVARAGGKWRLHAQDARGYQLGHAGGDQRELLRENVLTFMVQQPARNKPRSYAVLLLHRDLDDDSDSQDDFKPHADRRLTQGFRLVPEALDAVKAYFRGISETPDEAPVFSIAREQWAARDRKPLNRPNGSADAVSFAVASCQFPPALFDTMLAGAAYRAACRRMPLPGFLLLLGDQVYLDALGNAFENPNDSPEDRARRAYEVNGRLRPWRRYAAQVPVYPMLDDHEVIDDWQPPKVLSPDEDAALKAYRACQASLAPDLPPAQTSMRYDFLPGGMPFFVFDTRSQREFRSVDGAPGTVAIDRAAIAPAADMEVLGQWLHDHRAAPVKFIATPSVVLPFACGDTFGVPERLGLDSWSGYPASLRQLLGLLQWTTGTVVLLSGDPHLSVLSEFEFGGGSTCRLISIVSSGTYTPWPFANERACDLRLDVDVNMDLGGQERLTGRVTRHLVCDRAGLAYVELRRNEAGGLELDVSFAGDAAASTTLTL